MHGGPLVAPFVPQISIIDWIGSVTLADGRPFAIHSS